MKKLNLNSEIYPARVEIPVKFIDIFMPSASIEELKVYLYLVRASQDQSVSLTLDDMADLFDFTPNKIRKALFSLKSQGLVMLDERQGDIAGITLLPLDTDIDRGPQVIYPASLSGAASSEPEEEPDYNSEDNASSASFSSVPSEKKSASEEFPVDFNALYEDEEFNELLSVTECYMGHALSSVQKDGVAYCYLLFDRHTDMTVYLLEYCIEHGHQTFTYIKSVAKDWKEKGLASLEEIKAYVSSSNRTVSAVMKAFGITNRSLIKPELEYVDRWSSDFSTEMIKEACERTVLTIHSPSFKYADSILSSWKNSGFKTPDDLKANDTKHSEARKKDSADKGAKKPAPNTFDNFRQRETDYSKLIPSFFDK